MSVHVLESGIFFRTSIPINDQQRLLMIPPGRNLSSGDTVFLRDAEGNLKWVADVLFTGEGEGVKSWSGNEAEQDKYAILGWIARIHSGVLPAGKSRLQANWVLLNKKTLQTTLPWWEDHLLIYHSTMRLIEGLMTHKDVKKAEEAGCLVQHSSGHWAIPHGEARKRLLINVLNQPLVCGLCNSAISSPEEATQDHIIPISQGGPDSMVNIQLAHRECNEAKGNALPEQYPPFFTEPIQGRVYGDIWRAGRRNTRNRRGTRPPARPAGKYIAPPAPSVPASVAAAAASVAASVAAPVSEPKPIEPMAEPAAAKYPPSERENSRPDPKKPEKKAITPETKKSAEATVDDVWLAEVQGSGWSKLVSKASEQGWASKTASLRTIQQLRSRQISVALSEGRPVAEANGPTGQFRLLEWNDQAVLVEEQGDSSNYYQVKMLHSITPEVYTWYVSQFGRMAPMAVAMALLNIWNQGTPGPDGRISAQRGNQVLTFRIEGDRVVECCLTDKDTMVA